uniref:NodB homology domain-containing protein n=1 Tax=Spongospora subterranea TaxID=70186 RepID=A0A0H5QNX0_9EUKA|eukprot:CRZ03728.1 hypothetical protein [Spongospora subterranea]
MSVAEIPQGARPFRYDDAAPQPNADAKPAVAAALNHRKRNIILVVASVLLVLVGASVAVVVLTRSKNSGANNLPQFSVDSEFEVQFDPAVSDPSALIDEMISSGASSMFSVAAPGNSIKVSGPNSRDDANTIITNAFANHVSTFATVIELSANAVVDTRCADPTDSRCSENAMPSNESPAQASDFGFSNAFHTECKKGYFGPTCQQCQCSYPFSRCDDGMQGTGDCDCQLGSFGESCTQCPDCGHGSCLDGKSGSGLCSCPDGFEPDNCRDCLPNLFGEGCQQECGECGTDTGRRGKCDAGLRGSGQCRCANDHVEPGKCQDCKAGWAGDDCTILASMQHRAFDFCGKGTKLAAITFVGMPTRHIFGVLDQAHNDYQISGGFLTFFVHGGKQVEAEGEDNSCTILRQLQEQGHEIQLTGFSGESMGEMSATEIDEEIRKGQEFFTKCRLPEPTLFRPPMGKFDLGKTRYVNSKGLIVASYNVELEGTRLSGLVGDIFVSMHSGLSPLISIPLDRYNGDLGDLANAIKKEGFTLVKATQCNIASSGGSGIGWSGTNNPGVYHLDL